MSDPDAPTAWARLRSKDAATNIELFFDLVYVFAVTRLSYTLVHHTTVEGALQSLVLLALVWQVWVYTTWLVNYLDPDHTLMRVVLLLVMVGSLVLSSSLVGAFHEHGLLFAITYVVLQVGRSAIAVLALQRHRLQIVFLRILAWSALSGVAVVAGGLSHGHAREALWVLAIVLDIVGASVGFRTPGLGRPDTTEWTISGAHFAERCQAFVLIALGESVVALGSLLDIEHPTWESASAFAAGFAGVAALWWIYFDRAAEDSARVLQSSDDPGRLARSAFHYAHPLIIAGIITTAAADELLLEDPTARGAMPAAWLVLGGTALFLAGHAVFKAFVWRTVSWQRLAGAVVLLALIAVAPHVTTLTIGVCALVVVLAVAAADRILRPTDAAALLGR